MRAWHFCQLALRIFRLLTFIVARGAKYSTIISGRWPLNANLQSQVRFVSSLSNVECFVVAYYNGKQVLWLGPADWLVLLAGVAVAGLATLLFLIQ